MYNGYLIRVGNYEIPLSAMIKSSYKVTYSVLDLDSYRDANGHLHRTALRKVPTIEVGLHPLSSNQIADIFSNIASQYVNSSERKVLASVFIPEINGYYDGYFYIPDTQFAINKIVNNVVYYDETTFKIIGY